jgi:hypothetical protein
MKRDVLENEQCLNLTIPHLCWLRCGDARTYGLRVVVRKARYDWNFGDALLNAGQAIKNLPTPAEDALFERLRRIPPGGQ